MFAKDNINSICYMCVMHCAFESNVPTFPLSPLNIKCIEGETVVENFYIK